MFLQFIELQQNITKNLLQVSLKLKTLVILISLCYIKFEEHMCLKCDATCKIKKILVWIFIFILLI
jgi:hypothetical protein